MRVGRTGGEAEGLDWRMRGCVGCRCNSREKPERAANKHSAQDKGRVTKRTEKKESAASCTSTRPGGRACRIGGGLEEKN